MYRVDDKKNPFVINTMDYLNRYALQASKEYKLGYKQKVEDLDVEWLEKNDWAEFLDDTKNYVESIQGLVDHYKINDRLLEIVLEEFIFSGYDESLKPDKNIEKINIQHLMNRIGEEFVEIYFDDKDHIIRGVIDSKWQELEISDGLVRKAAPILQIMQKWCPSEGGCIILRNLKNFNEQNLSLLGSLKVLQKFKPNILHRFKGLGENEVDDMKLTILNPNTRMLIRVNMGDYENDMAVFQMLRGGSPVDMAMRRNALMQFDVKPEMIDT